MRAGYRRVGWLTGKPVAQALLAGGFSKAEAGWLMGKSKIAYGEWPYHGAADRTLRRDELQG